MGRKSVRDERRNEILDGFATVLADHGFAGATMQAVSAACELSPGLLHHHFKNKDEMLEQLLEKLVREFRLRTGSVNVADYVDGALELGARADAVAAKCWVSLFAEGLRNPKLFRTLQRLLDSEVKRLQEAPESRLDVKDASAMLAYILGSLVFGAYAPVKTSGFAAERGRRLLKALST